MLTIFETPDDPYSKDRADAIAILAEATPTRTPEHVYHYTDINGLEGILSQRTLWATDVAYMNDASEYEYTKGLVEEVLTTPGRRLAMADLIGRTANELGASVYASCFCETGDLLSQWRAYSGQGTGYAIEFNLKQLIEALGHIEPRIQAWVTVGKVEYDEMRQRGILKHIAERHLASTEPTQAEFHRAATTPVPQTQQKEKEQRVSKLMMELTSRSRVTMWAMLAIRPFLKSPAFSEEREWRIATMCPAQGESFRKSSGLFAPYRELPLGNADNLPITRVIIGPSRHPTQARASLERFLQNHNLNQIQVDASPIPLRL